VLLNGILYSEGFSFPDSLKISGDNIWVRAKPKTGKVVMKLNEGAPCKVLARGEEQVIRGQRDYWYQIQCAQGRGWFFGSQSNIAQPASQKNIEDFVAYFLEQAFFNKNTDSLIHVKSPLLNPFLHPQIPFRRLFNPGAACVISDYQFYNDSGGRYYGRTFPAKKPGLAVSWENIPEEQMLCAESVKDGIYLRELEKLPSAVVMDEEYRLAPLKISSKYSSSKLIRADVVLEGLLKRFYFAAVGSRWYLVLVNDCDCSA
jgi:hypothetical protein